MRMIRFILSPSIAHATISSRFVMMTLLCSVIFSLCSSCSPQPRYPAPPLIGTDVAVDVSSLQDEVPVFFTYEYQGRPVSFFIVRIDGKISSFLDACVSCYTRKQGYGYSNGRVTCRACGMKFALSQLEKGLGGCYPIKIEGKVGNGKYLIPVTILEASAEKF